MTTLVTNFTSFDLPLLRIIIPPELAELDGSAARLRLRGSFEGLSANLRIGCGPFQPYPPGTPNTWTRPLVSWQALVAIHLSVSG